MLTKNSVDEKPNKQFKKVYKPKRKFNFKKKNSFFIKDELDSEIKDYLDEEETLFMAEVKQQEDINNKIDIEDGEIDLESELKCDLKEIKKT